jgi:hypothetical protein
MTPAKPPLWPSLWPIVRRPMVALLVTGICLLLHRWLAVSLARQDPFVAALAGRGVALSALVAPLALLRFVLFVVMPPVLVTSLTTALLRWKLRDGVRK